MSKLLIAPTAADAQHYADLAHAWLTAHLPGYQAARWDIPRQHPTDGRWSIAYPVEAAAAFVDAEGEPLALTLAEDSPDWTPPEATP